MGDDNNGECVAHGKNQAFVGLNLQGILDLVGNNSALPWLSLPIVILSAGVAGYTAFLFGQCEGRDLWQTPLLLPTLLAQAVRAHSGTGMPPHKRESCTHPNLPTPLLLPGPAAARRPLLRRKALPSSLPMHPLPHHHSADPAQKETSTPPSAPHPRPCRPPPSRPPQQPSPPAALFAHFPLTNPIPSL